MSTFTWSPAPGASLAKQPRVRSAQFGDGYEQRVGDGINNSPRAWTVDFTRKTSDIDAIDGFLDAANGTASFDWTPPSGVAGKWLCAEWGRSVTDNRVQAISAVFREVFGD